VNTLDPYNLEAERAIVGALLETPSLLPTMPLDTEHFHPQHQPILLALRSAVAAHGSSVQLPQVVAELAKRDRLSAAGGPVYLTECVEVRALPSNLRWYAQEVEAAAMRRRIHEIGSRLVQQSTSTLDIGDLLDTIGEQHVALGQLMDTGVTTEAPITGLSSVDEFMAEPVTPYNWVIPGILEYAERAVLTAGEGAGKSVLFRQMAIAPAAGRHPFLPRYHIPQRRTLIVDLENPPNLIRRKLEMNVRPLQTNGVDLGGRCWIWREPAGIDVRTTVGYRALHRVLDQTNPDLVCIGPVYKMSASHGDKYEVEAAETQQAVDRLRHDFGCAFFLEHHSAKGTDLQGRRNAEPFGSSYWMRWPEFGLSLQKDRQAAGDEPDNIYSLGRFRGDRDERCWPTHLARGGNPLVPWNAMWDDLETEHMLATLCEEAFK
jgi:hypothetical protein